MERLINDRILEFYPDTMQYVRKIYNLDQPEAMQGAIDILEQWVQKQNHFIKKDYSRDYLERTIIRAKGSVERAKERIDKLCTSRTLIPEFFVNFDVRTLLLKDIELMFLPKLTTDCYRVYFVRCVGKDFKSEEFAAIYKRLIYTLEYMCAHDYCCRMLMLLDFQLLDIFNFLKHLNISDLGHAFNLILSGYGFRIKGIHIITTSRVIDSLVAIFKQILLNKKVAERILVYKTVEELYDHIDRNILPQDYGGKERPILELNQRWLDVLSSQDHNNYMNNINKAKTIEALRINLS